MAVENRFLQLNEGQDFVNLLNKEISSYENRDRLGLVGVFGSIEIGHDIDVMFYPSPKYTKGQFVEAQMEVLSRVKERLKKDYKSDLIPFPMLELQDEVEFISQRKPGEVFLHNLIFSDYKSLKERVPFIDKIISENLEVIHGDKKALENDCSDPLDYYYFTLLNNQVLLSNYPKELLSKKMKHIIGYVRKHALGEQGRSNAVLTQAECKKAYLDTILELDEAA